MREAQIYIEKPIKNHKETEKIGGVFSLNCFFLQPPPPGGVEISPHGGASIDKRIVCA